MAAFSAGSPKASQPIGFKTCAEIFIHFIIFAITYINTPKQKKSTTGNWCRASTAYKIYTPLHQICDSNHKREAFLSPPSPSLVELYMIMRAPL